MTRGWKIGLSIIGAIVLLIVIVVAGGGFYLYKNIQKSSEEAKTFAQQSDQAGCLKETLARQKQEDSPITLISNGGFLGVCLQNCKPTSGFCDGIPPSSDREKTSQWANGQCNQSGLSPATCAGLMIIVQAHCEGGTRKK